MEDLVTTAIAPRFGSGQTVVVDGAGHWPHVEQPATVAAHLDTFVAGHGLDTFAGGWTNAFATKSAAAFADDVVLEASVLTRPIEGWSCE
jgi:hypothetical protein